MPAVVVAKYAAKQAVTEVENYLTYIIFCLQKLLLQACHLYCVASPGAAETRETLATAILSKPITFTHISLTFWLWTK